MTVVATAGLPDHGCLRLRAEAWVPGAPVPGPCSPVRVAALQGCPHVYLSPRKLLRETRASLAHRFCCVYSIPDVPTDVTGTSEIEYRQRAAWT